MSLEAVRTRWTGDSILEVLHTNREHLRSLGVQKIGLFGSYVRGQQQPGSDMDFLFEMDNLTFAGWMDVWNFLEDTFNCRVDLVPEQDLRDELRPHVLSEVRYVAGL